MKLYLIIEQISFLVMFLCFASFIVLYIYSRKAGKRSFSLRASAEKTRFAILVPARNESGVIEANIKSVIASDYPKESYEIFVIVESSEDPTAEIVNKYDKAHLFVRRDLDGKHMKGYALDECIKDIFSGEENFDAFLILDADNLIASDFLSKMSDAYQAGYHAACGKRNNKDWNSSVVSSASALTFTVINTLQNKPKTERGMNVTFSGTGFYVATSVLRELGGWPFASLTEDYEFSNYAVVNELKTCYVDSAVYYDEQPNSLSQSIIQRTRWVRGFFQVKKEYRNSKKQYAKKTPDSKDIRAMKYGTTPFLILAIDVILYLVASIVAFVIACIAHNGRQGVYGVRILLIFFTVYILIALFTVFLFSIEKDSIDITRKNKIKTVFYHPIFLATYVISAVRCLFIKNTWEVINHGNCDSDKE